MPAGVIGQRFQLEKIIIHVVVGNVVGVHDLVDGIPDLPQKDLIPGHVWVIFVYVEEEELALVLVSHVSERDSRHDIVIIDEAKCTFTKTLIEAGAKFQVADPWLSIGIQSINGLGL